MNESKVSTADCDLILRLYDLRRETEMRKARNWFASEFWPRSFEDVQRLFMDFTKPENAWFRQVLTYWDMACALVAHGGLHSGLFNETNHEAYFVYAKIKPFVAQIRTTFNNPEFLANLERVAESTPEGRERLGRLQQNLARWAEMRSSAQKAH